MKKFVLIVFAALTVVACKKADIKPTGTASATGEGVTDVTTGTYTAVDGKSITPCGTAVVKTLYAGRTIVAGTVTVVNDATNLYVIYNTTGGWEMKKTHLYAGDCAAIPATPAGNPKIGLFPYQTTHSPRVTSFTYTIPLSKLGSCYCIAAHAELVKVNADGTTASAETGWAAGDPFGGSSWATKFSYCTQTCSEPCYGSNMTAWSNGPLYMTKYPGATYTPYEGTEKKVTLFADVTTDAGTVTFSAPGALGQVTITIDLKPGFALAAITEPVHAEGYNLDPFGAHPVLSDFDTYKGADLRFTVPFYHYYGVHVIVRPVVPCS